MERSLPKTNWSQIDEPLSDKTVFLNKCLDAINEAMEECPELINDLEEAKFIVTQTLQYSEVE